MDSKIQNILGIAIIAALLLFVAASFWYVNSFSASVAPQRSFQVQGEGKVVVLPDVAQISFGVLTEGGTNISELQKQNTEKANRIINFLKDQGIDDKDIKTQQYNISPRYEYFSCPRPLGQETKPCPPPEIVGYTISQSISVKVRKMDMVGDILAGVVARGANNISGPTFTIDDPKALQQQAREKAIAEAKQKAEDIAKAGGFQLGKLLSLQEGVSMPSPILPMARFAEGSIEEAAPEIEPGSQEITVSVTLTYEIQ